MAYINTETNQYPISEHDIRVANPNVSFPIPFQPPTNYKVVSESPKPNYNPIIEYVKEIQPILTVKGHYEQCWEVVKLFKEYTDDQGIVHTVEEQETTAIAADNAKKEAAAAELVQFKVQTLWSAADKYVSNFISGLAVGILTMGVMQSKPKCLAVSEWSNMIWGEYYRRKALVTVDSVDDHDFSVYGPIPYTAPELQAEVGL